VEVPEEFKVNAGVGLADKILKAKEEERAKGKGRESGKGKGKGAGKSGKGETGRGKDRGRRWVMAGVQFIWSLCCRSAKCTVAPLCHSLPLRAIAPARHCTAPLHF
jgi:hypothetical protein